MFRYWAETVQSRFSYASGHLEGYVAICAFFPGASSKRKLFESGKAIGYCHYTQLVNKCRKLEDESERIGVALEGTGRSKSRKDGQQATVVGDAGTDDGAAPKRGTCGDGDGTPSLANEFAADTPGTGCSMYGASHCCEERKGSPRAGQMNLETQVCAYWHFVPEVYYLGVQWTP